MGFFRSGDRFILKTKNMRIDVSDMELKKSEDDEDIITVTAKFNTQLTGDKKTIRVPISSLKNYIDQYSLHLNESLNLSEIFKVVLRY